MIFASILFFLTFCSAHIDPLQIAKKDDVRYYFGEDLTCFLEKQRNFLVFDVFFVQEPSYNLPGTDAQKFMKADGDAFNRLTNIIPDLTDALFCLGLSSAEVNAPKLLTQPRFLDAVAYIRVKEFFQVQEQGFPGCEAVKERLGCSVNNSKGCLESLNRVFQENKGLKYKHEIVCSKESSSSKTPQTTLQQKKDLRPLRDFPNVSDRHHTSSLINRALKGSDLSDDDEMKAYGCHGFMSVIGVVMVYLMVYNLTHFQQAEEKLAASFKESSYLGCVLVVYFFYQSYRLHSAQTSIEDLKNIQPNYVKQVEEAYRSSRRILVLMACVTFLDYHNNFLDGQQNVCIWIMIFCGLITLYLYILRDLWTNTLGPSHAKELFENGVFVVLYVIFVFAVGVLFALKE